MSPKRRLFRRVVPPATEALMPIPAMSTYTRAPILIASIIRERGASRDERDRLARVEGDIELARDQVRRSRRDDAERDRAPREAVDDGGNRAVPSRGDDQVEALAQARADDLSERIPLAGLMDGVFDAGRGKMPLQRLEHGLADGGGRGWIQYDESLCHRAFLARWRRRA